MMERKQIGSVLYLHGGGKLWGVNACDKNSWDFQVHFSCGKEWQVGSKHWRNCFSAPAGVYQDRKWTHYCHVL